MAEYADFDTTAFLHTTGEDAMSPDTYGPVGVIVSYQSWHYCGGKDPHCAVLSTICWR